MGLRLAAHIIAGILITGFFVWLIGSITDAAWKALQARSATRRAAVKLLDSWSHLADAQREQLEPEPRQPRAHLRVVRDEEPS